MTIVSGPAFDAQAEARRIVDEAKRDAEAIRAEARRDGFAEGRQEALAQISGDAVRVAVDRARGAVAAEADLRRLAVRIAERILGAELAMTPEKVVEIVRQAIGAARSRKPLTVRVHPDDAPLVEKALAEAPLAVVADANVDRGGCIVDTGRGTVDARLATQLAAIERALAGDE